MPEIETFLEELAEEGQRLLPGVDPSMSVTWLVRHEGDELMIDQNPDGEAHELMRDAVDAGAKAAAYLSYIPGYNEQMLAYVLVTAPDNSDIRRAYVTRESDSVTLGGWQHTV
jgi:hypothetical protein